jgi:hypothetical protein
MWIRRMAVAVIVPLALPAVVGAAPADAARHGASSISVHASDPTPRLGEEFVLRGRYLANGGPAAGHAVKVQTYRHGEWANIKGAKVTARPDGRYRVRVILFVEGVRDLRVVGIASDHNSYHRIVVEVH